MSTTVTVYRYDDPGAPVLAGNSFSLIPLLDACLVNGYGAKAAAGWTKPFSGTNLAAYRMENIAGYPRMYFRVSHTATLDTNIIGYEDMTDVNTGTNRFPTSAQLSTGVHLSISNSAVSTARPWVLIASGVHMILLVRGNAAAADAATSPGTTADTGIRFGAFPSFLPGDGYNVVLSGGLSVNQSTLAAAHLYNVGPTAGGTYFARSILQTPGAALAGQLGERFSDTTLGNSGAAAYPDPITGGLDLSRIVLTELAGSGRWTARGVTPGTWVAAAAQSVHGFAPFSEHTGTGPLAGKTFILMPTQAAATVGWLFFETSGTLGL